MMDADQIYVILPDAYCDTNSRYVLCQNMCQKDFLKEFDFSNTSYVFVAPGELLCRRWSEDILEKFGKCHHLDGQEMYYYISYMSIIRSRNFSYEILVCEELRVKYNIIDELRNYFLNKNYRFIIPSNKCGIELSVDKINKYFGINKKEKAKILLSHKKVMSLLIGDFFEYTLRLYTKANAIRISKCIKYLNQQNIKGLSALHTDATTGTLAFEGYTGSDHIFIKVFDILNKSKDERIFCQRYFEGLERISIRFIDIIENLNYCSYEYVQYGTLETKYHEKKMDTKAYRSLEYFLKDTIKLLYENKIVHADIRPENIMIIGFDEEGVPVFRLSDWGWAFKKEQNYHNRRIDYFYKRMFSRVGADYRSSKSTINDASSAYKVLMEFRPKGIDFDRDYFVKYSWGWFDGR